MTGWPFRLGVNQGLAAGAALLGAVAVLGNPYHGGVVTVDTQELAAIVQGGLDQVSVQELAAWIIEQRTDYRLIDVRDAAAYADYHIPTAEHVAIGGLLDYPLYRNEKILLYADDDLRAAQAWFLLRAQGFPGVYIVRGGLNAWKDQVLFPALPEGATPEAQAAFEQAREVSAFFGGTPRTDVAEEPAEAIPMPKVDMPPTNVVQPKRKRQKQGC
jgi:rhodanese-related sulfurtransferase